MPNTHAMNDARRARWPVVVLVLGSVAAASLALGLLVVGPMIQRHMETPPPVLSVSGTSAVTPAQPSVSAADVEIKERVVRRPAPRPISPSPDELNLPLGTSPSTGDAASGLTDARSASSRAKPTIKATVTDGSGDTTGQPFGAGGASDHGAREGHRIPRRTEDSANAADGGSIPSANAAEARPRPSSVPKARSRRASPLDALPVLDPNGPGSSDDKQLPGAAPLSTPEVHPSGKSYRVQVGRFGEQQQAEKLRDELAQSGMSPRVVKTQKGGTTVYRVQVGTYRQKENADRQIEMLKSRSYEPYLAEDEP